jgi:hypothetical protein
MDLTEAREIMDKNNGWPPRGDLLLVCKWALDRVEALETQIEDMVLEAKEEYPNES